MDHRAIDVDGDIIKPPPISDIRRSILPTAIGCGRIDRFSSCGLGLGPGLVQHAGCFAASTHCTILQLDINSVT